MNRIWVKEAVIKEIFLQGEELLPKETGGILMGYTVESIDFVITNIIGPGKNAVHGDTTFQPDQRFHEDEIARIYEESGGLITYLGDWHTHPNSYPYLSSKDQQTIVSIAKYKEARLSNPLMLIAAPPEKEFKIWIYRKTKILRTRQYIEGDVIMFNS